MPYPSSGMEALSSLDPPPNAELIGGHERSHNDIDNKFRQIDRWSRAAAAVWVAPKTLLGAEVP